MSKNKTAQSNPFYVSNPKYDKTLNELRVLENSLATAKAICDKYSERGQELGKKFDKLCQSQVGKFYPIPEEKKGYWTLTVQRQYGWRDKNDEIYYYTELRTEFGSMNGEFLIDDNKVFSWRRVAGSSYEAKGERVSTYLKLRNDFYTNFFDKDFVAVIVNFYELVDLAKKEREVELNGSDPETIKRMIDEKKDVVVAERINLCAGQKVVFAKRKNGNTAWIKGIITESTPEYVKVESTEDYWATRDVKLKIKIEPRAGYINYNFQNYDEYVKQEEARKNKEI